MRKLVTTLFLFISFICYGQLPDGVKHIEVASEVADTMILLNKPDLDKINTTFYRLHYMDSLNVVNDKIIAQVTTEKETLRNIISEQKIIIGNKDTQISQIKEQNKEVISDLEKQVKRANRKKTFWEVTTGVSVVGLIFSLIFGK